MTARELPILFSGGMVQRILSGDKTQTRRRVPGEHDRLLSRYRVGDKLWCRETHRVIGWDDSDVAWIEYRASPELDPKPMRILTDDIEEWHQKNWSQLTKQGWIEKDGNMVPPVKGQKPHWKPSIFLERWMSRITLEVTQVRVERLQQISEADAIAEGVMLDVGCPCEGDDEEPGKHVPLCRWNQEDWPGETPLGVDDENRMAYASLWESINGKRSWSANPFVWVYTFKRVT